MVQAARQRVIKCLRDVARTCAVTPGEVLFAVIAAFHGDALLHGAHDGAEVAAYAVLLDDRRFAVRGVVA